MIERWFDEEAGIIRVITDESVWTREDVDAHYHALNALIAPLRERGEPIRLLSDVRRAPRQDPSIELYIKGWMERTYRPGDRVAVLTADADKAYLRAVIGAADIAAFSSELPAEMWLFLDELEKRRGKAS